MTNLLYSFRRCPYAIRARLAIVYSQQTVQLREVVLKNKPQEMLQLSSKGTVPILQINDTEVLDESLDIMVWAISQNDPDNWLTQDIHPMLALVDKNDFEFKGWLDKYKYADRFPEYSEHYYREQCEEFLVELEQRLQINAYLFSANLSLADIAIVPFIRQFALVNEQWFKNSPYPHLQKWLYTLINSPLFDSVMLKYSPWSEQKQQYELS
ncbi:glutathione S-transferase [Psychromonas marina]|uniref:Glutathione S-transferase n=1 Tax=Psychromonas marina TaxID=88364 RepID=A0ABQ6DXZ2_9GAMM|nr:glutathione S-transferase [Psychromonas marina]GLS89858.1 glutathione S-transferase [Psychromonas marina]